MNGDLNQLLCWEYERQVQNDWTVSFKNECYQIKKTYGVGIKPKSKIIIRKHLDGSISAWFKQQPLPIEKLSERPKPEIKPPLVSTKPSSSTVKEAPKSNKAKTPWARFNKHWLNPKKENKTPSAV